MDCRPNCKARRQATDLKDWPLTVFHGIRHFYLDVGRTLRLAEMLHASMVSTFPQLKGLRVDYAWSGLMSYARHLMPQIAPIEDGLWSCTAFGGHGLDTTAIGGKILAEAILGDSNRWRLFLPFGFDWNGATAGRIAVQATYWWLQARDLVGEALSRADHTSA